MDIINNFHFSYPAFFTGIICYILGKIGIKTLKKIRTKETPVVKPQKHNKIKLKTNKSRNKNTQKEITKNSFANRIPKIIFIIIFLQICMYSVGFFNSSMVNVYTEWRTFFLEYAISNIMLTIFLLVFYLIFFYSTLSFLLPIFYLSKSERYNFLKALKTDERFILSTKALLVTVILRLFSYSVPLFFESKFINEISILINQSFFPFLKVWAIKIWTTVIIGIIIPGIVGNFFYDIIKKYTLKKFFSDNF